MDSQQSAHNVNPPRHVDESYDVSDGLVAMPEVKPEEADNAGATSAAQPNPPETQRALAPEAGPAKDDDSKSDGSFDPLFDDEPDADGEGETDNGSLPPQSATQSSYPGQTSQSQPQQMFQPAKGPAALAPKNAPPVLDSLSYSTYSPNVIMIASIDGQIVLWDKRVNTPGRGVGRLWVSEKTPPWCVSVSISHTATVPSHKNSHICIVSQACWSADGGQIYAGRRNETIDIYDVRQIGTSASGIPRILKTLRNPASSGVVSCVVPFPDGRHLAWYVDISSFLAAITHVLCAVRHKIISVFGMSPKLENRMLLER